MIEYPSGNWETDMKIPGSFTRNYIELMENIFNQDIPIRLFKNERFNIVYHYATEAAKLDGDFIDCGFEFGEYAFFMAKQCKTNVHVFHNWEMPLTFTDHDNDFYKENSFLVQTETLKSNLAQFDNITFHDSLFPAESDNVSSVSLVNIDLKTYTLTKLALETLWDKVVEGGAVLVNFHDSIATGAEKATRDFFLNLRDINVLPTGKAVIIK